MRSWKRTYLVPGILLKRTRQEIGSSSNKAYAIPKGSIVLYLGISSTGPAKLVAKFLHGEKIYEHAPFSAPYGYSPGIEQIEAWIKSNFRPITEKDNE